jgi:phage-related holin
MPHYYDGFKLILIVIKTIQFISNNSIIINWIIRNCKEKNMFNKNVQLLPVFVVVVILDQTTKPHANRARKQKLQENTNMY